MATFQGRLEEALKLRNMRARDLSSITGITEGTISEYRRGKYKASQVNLYKMAKALDVDPAWLMGVSDNMSTRKWKFSLDLFGNKEDSPTTWIPVVGRIPAGTPIEAIEDVVDHEDIPAALARRGEYFGLRVVGNSMTPNYLDGDTIIVRKQNTCESGDDCVVMVNGNDATFKRVTLDERGIVLRPLNPDYDTYFYSNEEIERLPVTIAGVAVEVRRKIGR